MSRNVYRSKAYINRLKAGVKKRQKKEAFVKRMKSAKRKEDDHPMMRGW